MSALRAAFVAASVAWAVMLALAPYVASRSQASPAGTAFVVAVYGIGSLICHQLPARSYRLWSVQLPVCARCTGIYVGAAIAAIVAAAAPLKRRPTYGAKRRPGYEAPLNRCLTYGAVAGHRLSDASASRTPLIIAALPTLLTLSYEWTAGHMPAHWIRAAAGVPIGAVVAWLVVAAADNRVN